jgi:hypothetical protein
MFEHSRRDCVAFAAAAAAALSVAGSAAAATRPDRPYGGTCSTVVVPLGPPPQVLGGTQQLSISYECTLAHLGRTTASVQQTVTLTGASPAGLTLSLVNSTVYTAANGDQLIATFTGSALLDPASGDVTFTGFEIFSGGGGRFANATGWSALEGSASVVTNRGFFTTKGRISY